MGVLPCIRNNCDNIMCDRYSTEYGYLCWECFNELISSSIILGDEGIRNFLSTYKSKTNQDLCRVYYNEIFKERE